MGPVLGFNGDECKGGVLQNVPDVLYDWPVSRGRGESYKGGTLLFERIFACKSI